MGRTHLARFVSGTTHFERKLAQGLGHSGHQTDARSSGSGTLGRRPPTSHPPSSGRRRGSVKEEAASPPRQANAPFTIGPRPAGQRDRQYLSAEVCRCYWETTTTVPCSDVHLPNAWHLSAERVPIPLLPTSGRAHQDKIERRRRLLPDDLYYDYRYVADSTLWDTWLRDKHDVRRTSYFAGTASGPQQAREWGCELVPHAAAVTGARGLVTGGGAASSCQLPARHIHHGSSSHLWTPPAYVDLVIDSDGDGGSGDTGGQ
ncbi:ADP-ribosylation factor-related protein 1 [Hordeum vulgare]|nr:ADP-ribosylation factor-related protein 1 [Hordeum vulgare]